MKKIMILALCLGLSGGLALADEEVGVDFTVWTFDDYTYNPPEIDLTGNAVAARGPGLGVPGSGEFPTGNPGRAWSSVNWALTPAEGDPELDAEKYKEFMVDLTFYGEITFSFDGNRSGTGPKMFEIHYSTDGTNFTLLPGSVTDVITDGWESYTFDLIDINVLIIGEAEVYFRIFGYHASGAAGTWRLDNVNFFALTDEGGVVAVENASLSTVKDLYR